MSAISDRSSFVERTTRFLVPEDDKAARASMHVDGLYDGSSQRIHELIRTAWRRGVRRGASAAWSSIQPIGLRQSEGGERS